MRSIGVITETDPLARAMEDSERELFCRLTRVAGDGHWSPEQVAHAAMNLVCNAIRQGFENRRDAEKTYDALVGQLKTILLDHYDRASGKRRSVFAHDQIVEMPLLRADDKF